MESERGGVMSDSRYTRLTWKMGGLSCPYYSEEKKKVGEWREGRKIYLRSSKFARPEDILKEGLRQWPDLWVQKTKRAI